MSATPAPATPSPLLLPYPFSLLFVPLLLVCLLHNERAKIKQIPQQHEEPPADYLLPPLPLLLLLPLLHNMAFA